MRPPKQEEEALVVATLRSSFSLPSPLVALIDPPKEKKWTGAPPPRKQNPEVMLHHITTSLPQALLSPVMPLNAPLHSSSDPPQ